MNREISRRTMLKRVGAVGAVAWTAPILTSLGSKAWASESKRCAGNDWNCGDPFSICGEGPEGQVCLCDVDTSGNTVCWQDISCGSSPACQTNADCPPGWICATNCCGTTCIPPCGTQVQSSESGPTAAGRVL